MWARGDAPDVGDDGAEGGVARQIGKEESAFHAPMLRLARQIASDATGPLRRWYARDGVPPRSELLV